MRLADRAAIVTGAASGIGAATAHLLAQHGAAVLAVDRPEATFPDDFNTDERIAVHIQDVAEDGAADRIVRTAVDRFDRLDILVNNAGVAFNALAEATTPEQWDRTLAVNATAAFRLAQAAIPALKQAPAGRIVTVASVAARLADYGLAAYCASKAAVAGFTRTLALELGKYGITANYVEPGSIVTGMTRASFQDADIAAVWAKKAALRRLGQPEDIARAILFLASDDGGFVTGHGLVVDGGLTLRM